jgi:hypothetical protein
MWVVMLEGEDLLDQIGEALEKGQVKITRNRHACMKNLMTVEEAKGLEGSDLCLPQREMGVMLYMFVRINDNNLDKFWFRNKK